MIKRKTEIMVIIVMIKRISSETLATIPRTSPPPPRHQVAMIQVFLVKRSPEMKYLLKAQEQMKLGRHTHSLLALAQSMNTSVTKYEGSR
jgi:hypothetical protein